MDITRDYQQFFSIKGKVINGFTLIELMIVVAVVALLLTVGIPSFSSVIKDNRQTTLLNEFNSFFHYARNIAVTQGEYVTLCSRNTEGTDCDSTSDWDDGWIVFIDINHDGDLDDNGDTTLCESGEDCVLKIHEAIDNSISISASSLVVKINTKGFTSASTFTFCDSDGTSFKTKILSKTGRWSSSSTHLSC
ncbi:MAG: GspH/FimT family pseudopilin [Methylococcaceae bacterium]|nr:GspH/FimT family pseudopilin [Methylococcaceae bacterium]